MSTAPDLVNFQCVQTIFKEQSGPLVQYTGFVFATLIGYPYPVPFEFIFFATVDGMQSEEKQSSIAWLIVMLSDE